MRLKYVLSEAVIGLWRNVTMTIAMIITMGVSLTLLGASVLLYLQVNKMRDVYYGQVEVTIFLQPDVTAEQKALLESELARDDLVVQPVVYESKEQAYERFKEIFAAAPDLTELTPAEQLPESYRVKLKDTNNFGAFSSKYQKYIGDTGGIDTIVDQKQLVEKVFTVLGSLQKLALIIAIVQGVAGSTAAPQVSSGQGGAVPPITGAGASQAPAQALSASGAVLVRGAGALVAPSQSVAGSGEPVIAGVGAMLAP